jgi:hypothetical protein
MNPFLQKIMGIGVGILSSLCLFLIYKFPNVWVFIPVFFIWLIILIFVNKYIIKRLTHNRINNFALSITTVVAFVSLISIVEWKILQLFLILLAGFIIANLFSWTVGEYMSYAQKPYRRMIMMLWVFDAYALLTVFFAVGVLFTGFPFWILALSGGVFFGFVSIMIWKMYYEMKKHKLLLWAFVVFLIMFEIIWVFHFLTFAHLAAGFFITWIWYLITLFVRFHFDHQGIVWKKQKWFLLTNIVLYVILLIFFVRWV